MEWVLVNPQVQSTLGSLGCFEGEVYRINDDCLSSLEKIYTKLIDEDRILRSFRRTIGFGQNIKKDLVPILVHVKDNPEVIELTIKILVNLTTPVECLLSVEEMSRNNVGRHTVFEMNNLLLSSKEAFVDSRATKSILDYANHIIENNVKLSLINVDNINNSLLLLRNILHIPEVRVITGQQPSPQSQQNQILWNLFTQSIDKTLLYLITSTYGTHCSITIVQLLALIYKDQHIETLQKILNLWFEASLSESSEDNESNTYPPDQGSDDSSPTLTSDPTSDSSDNGDKGKNSIFNVENINKNTTLTGQQTNVSTCQKLQENEKHNITSADSKNSEIIISNSAIITNRLNGKRGPTTPLSYLTCSGPNTGPKRECISAHSEFSDCGYVTQIENRESVSTSSNEEDEVKPKHFHPKAHTQKQRHNAKKRHIMTIQERKERQRKKLIERGKTNKINMKGLLHYLPTDDDITNMLKEFTVDFLLKGYGSLVHSLHSQLTCNVNLQIDTSHFFWLLTYFLKFAAQLELDLEFVHQVLSFDIISYLIYEGVHLCEQIQLLSKFQSNDLKSCLRRMHLVITAIREFIQTIDIYKKISHLSDKDRVQLVKLQMRLSSTEDLRCLFVLLLRHYQPDVHSKQFLHDLIVTNHVFLIFLDNSIKRHECKETVFIEHIQQFATVEVMHQYGILLQDYKTNGEYINDCIFTMMHHVGGDLGNISALFQPNILKTFLSILESRHELFEDWMDLIDYVINIFMKNPKAPKIPIVVSKISDKIDLAIDICDVDSWTEEELDNLQWNYMQSATNPKIIENICSLYKDEGIIKTHNSVLKQLLKKRLISKEEYKTLLICSGSKKDVQEYFNFTLPSKLPVTNDEVDVLKSELEKQNMSKALSWLQKILLEVCFAKLSHNNEKTNEKQTMIETLEPIPYHNVLMNQSTPVVPWNNEQSTAIHNQTFLILLHRLGFHLPVDSGKLFVRIPNFWTPDVLFYVACRLGPIDESSLKFDVKQFFPDVSLSELTSDSNKKTNCQNENKNELVLQVQHTKKVSSVETKVTELSPTLLIQETKISTIEEKCSNWINVVNTKPTTMQTEEPLSTQITMLPDEKMNEEFSSHIAGLTAEDSLCETASITSDLTRMYVSDEEEKID